MELLCHNNHANTIVACFYYYLCCLIFVLFIIYVVLHVDTTLIHVILHYNAPEKNFYSDLKAA